MSIQAWNQIDATYLSRHSKRQRHYDSSNRPDYANQPLLWTNCPPDRQSSEWQTSGPHEVYEMLKLLLLVILSGTVSLPALAGSVDIRHVTFSKQAHTWMVSATLQHADTGWQHYADAWRIVTETGKVLATRLLYHPHVNEQPFSRSLVNVKLPDEVQQVQIEARCNVHGWGKAPLRVDLNISKTPRYDINRED